MALEIRPVLPEEHEEAGRLAALAYREFVGADDGAWKEYLQHIADVEDRVGSATVLVAVENGRILGSATLELDGRIDDDPPLHPHEAHIRMLGVDPQARGRGIARAHRRLLRPVPQGRAGLCDAAHDRADEGGAGDVSISGVRAARGPCVPRRFRVAHLPQGDPTSLSISRWRSAPPHPRTGSRRPG